MGKANPTGYSASVRLWLLCGGQRIPLSHTAATYVIAWQPVQLSGGDATVIFKVDDKEYQRDVSLLEMRQPSCNVEIRARDGIAPF
jgi:hypothetical protein